MRAKIAPKTYYAEPAVAKEIADFLKNRWVAVHCGRRIKDGRYLIVRYWRGRPLTVSSSSELQAVVKKFSALGVRTFYGSASIYRRLETREDALDYVGNVVARTPSWDIDSRPEWWRATLKVARVIVDVLEKEGVARSVWLKWSGRGLHIHVHERAFSRELYACHHPIDVAWAVVGYVASKVYGEIRRINAAYACSIKVENLMDPQRVFTAPLSLHRELDVACVAFKPEEIDDFDPAWLDPLNPRHNPDWRRYDEGEGDELAERALARMGGYPHSMPGRRRPQTPLKIDDIAKFAPPWLEELERLRLNMSPKGLKSRVLSLGPGEAVRLLEDIISMYALGKAGLEETVTAIRTTLESAIRAQSYSEKEREKLEGLYAAALDKLLELRDPERVKKWLLSHGPPR